MQRLYITTNNMKKILFIAFLAVFAAITASAQNAGQLQDNWYEHLQDNWQKTITVPNSQASTIEKLFSAWGKEFPNCFVDAYNKFKKTGEADNIKINDKYEEDFDVELAPKNGYLELRMPMVEPNDFVTAVYWNLPTGNKLFAVSVQIGKDVEVHADSKFSDLYYYILAFYEYDIKKGILTPRPEISKKLLGITKYEYVSLPKEGRDVGYYDKKTDEYKVIKWNGNGF